MKNNVKKYKKEVYKILKSKNEDIEKLSTFITDESIIFAINNKFSPQVYVGGLLF